MSPVHRGIRSLAAALLLAVGSPALAQEDGALPGVPVAGAAAPPPFRSAADSVAWERAREAALGAPGRRLVVSIRERRVRWMDGERVLFEAPVAVGKGTRLADGRRVWDFSTPRGVRRVTGKQENPVWTPPDWHYVELARDSAYRVVYLQRGRSFPVGGGKRLEVRGDRVVEVRPDGRVETIPADEEVIYGRTLYVPPLGTAHRRIPGELGNHKLDLGDGYMLHGTPHQDSIGTAATHGCIRLRDADVLYLYENVPVGTPVHLF